MFWGLLIGAGVLATAAIVAAVIGWGFSRVPRDWLAAPGATIAGKGFGRTRFGFRTPDNVVHQGRATYPWFAADSAKPVQVRYDSANPARARIDSPFHRGVFFKVAALLLAMTSAGLAALWVIVPVILHPLGPGLEAVDCSQAVKFIDRTELPAGATQTHCTYVGFQDSQYEMEFVVDRQSLQQWLTELPGSPTLSAANCGKAELCIEPVEFQPRAKGGADTVKVTATTRADGKLAVKASAFNS